MCTSRLTDRPRRDPETLENPFGSHDRLPPTQNNCDGSEVCSLNLSHKARVQRRQFWHWTCYFVVQDASTCFGMCSFVALWVVKLKKVYMVLSILGCDGLHATMAKCHGSFCPKLSTRTAYVSADALHYV